MAQQPGRSCGGIGGVPAGVGARGDAPLPQLFAAAGAKLAFDAETMGGLVALIEAQIAALEVEA